MRCPACGAEAANGTRFCEMCGAPLQQATQPMGDAQPTTTPTQPMDNAQPMPTPTPETTPMSTPTPSPTQPMNNTYGQQSYEAPRSHEPSAGGSAANWEGARQPTPTPQGVPPKQGSSAPFVLAIIALVTAVLGLFPISLVLAIIALVMNREQKKRGEQSTKQTPTFVMALIGLILSILMALATLALGGMVWLALMNDDADIEHVTTSTAPQQTTPAESPVGMWKVVSMTSDEGAYDEDYLKLMEDLGITVELVIAQDGTASLELFDESETGTWEDRGSGKIAITFDGDTLVGTISEDELTFSYDGNDMVLRRSSKAAPATAGGASSDEGTSSASSASSSGSASSEAPSISSSAASSSTSPSESASASSQAAGTYDAKGEPTLGDFTWYAGAGGIPAGADILTSIYDVEGTWKAYLFGNDMDRLCTLSIEAGNGDATATIDWDYVHDTTTDTGADDNTPDSVFTGDWNGALGLDATGPGRLELTDFWQQGSHQYGTGTFMWPSGETDTVLLARP